VYDMYPWNSAPAPSAPKPPKVPTVPPATSAVQVALDRRDNGGDAAAEPTAALARQ
jgi:hypothetical protein